MVPQRDCLARHLAPLLEAAAAEQLEGTVPANAGPSIRLLRHLLCGHAPAFPSPWALGLPVAPPLLPLLWSRYAQHLACAVTQLGHLEEEEEGPAGSLAGQLGAALAAAPGEAHEQELAAAVLDSACPCCAQRSTHVASRPAYVQLALSAADMLEAGAATGGGSPVSMAAGRAVLTAALASAGWLASHGAGHRPLLAPRVEARQRLLCMLRRCLAAAPARVTLLLECHRDLHFALQERLEDLDQTYSSSHCQVPALWAAVLGMEEEGAALKKCGTAVEAAQQGRAQRRRIGKAGLPLRLPWRQL